MTGVLGFDDNGDPSAVTVQVLAKRFPLREELSGGDGDPIPPHVPAGARAHSWHAPVYNAGAWVLSLIRGMIAWALYVGATVHLVAIGDSKTEGYNTGGARWRWSWVGILRAMLGGVEGAIPAFEAGIDPRWTLTNLKQGTAAQLGLIPNVTGQPWAATLTYDVPHVGAAFLIHSDTATTVTVTVDGGASQTFPVAAGNGFRTVTPAVTGVGPHTYTVAGTADMLLALFVPTYDGPRLKVTNLGRSGATAAYWRPGYSANGTGLWDVLTATAPDAILGQLGTNQPADTASLTALWADVAALGKPALIITPGGLTGDEYAAQYGAQFTAADTHDLPLIDGASVIGTGPYAQAQGLMADDRHENRRGFAYIAAAIHRLLT